MFGINLKSRTTWTGIAAVVAAVAGYFTGEVTVAPAVAGVLGGLAVIFGRAAVPARVKAPAPPKEVAAVVPVLALALMLAGCTTTNYNIDFHKGAFRVADKMKIDPGQGGDDGSSTAGAPTTGGEDGSPGGSNVLDGFAQQGNIFQIGTAAKSDGEVRTAVTAQSPNSTSGTGEDVVVNAADAEPEPTE